MAVLIGLDALGINFKVYLVFAMVEANGWQ